MTRNLQRIGGKALVALMATMMLLSVFAGPAAAGTTDEDRVVISADDFEVNGEAEHVATGTSELKLTLNEDGSLDSGDQIIIETNSDTVFGAGDIQITDVSNLAGNGDLENNVEAEVFNGSVFASDNDSIAITVNSENVDSSDDITFEIEFEVDERFSEEAAGVTDETLFEIATDETGNGLDVGGEEELVELDIQPGEPDELDITQVGTDTITYEESSSTITVGLEDQFENTLQSDGFGESDDLEDLEAENVIFEAGLLNASGETVTGSEIDTEEESVTIDLTSNDEQTTFDVNPDDDNDGEISEVVVGDQLLIEVDDADIGSTDTDSLTVEPNAIEITADTETVQNADDGDADKVIADDGETDVEVVLQDDSDDRIDDGEIDEIQVQFSDLDTAALGSDNVEFIAEDFIFDTDQVVIEENLDDTAGNVLVFNETDNAFSEDVEVAVDPRVGSSGVDDTASIDVISGSPEELAFDADIITEPLNEVDELGTVDVEIRDAQDNEINDRSFGDVDVEVEIDEDEQDDTTTVTVSTGGSSGAEEISLQRASTDAGGANELAIAAGSPAIELEQLGSGSLGIALTDDDNVTANIYPQVSIEDEPEDGEAGVENTGSGDALEVQLQYQDNNEEVSDTDDIGTVEVQYDFTDRELQEGVDSQDVDADLIFDGLEDNPLTLTHTGNEINIVVDYNSTTAGEFEIDVDAIPAIDEGPDTATSSDFVVDATVLDDEESEIRTVDNDFVGTIVDEDAEDDTSTDSTIELELRDEFNNLVGYDNNPNFDDGNVQLDVAGEEIEDEANFDDIIVNSMNDDVEDADEEFEYEFTPTDLSDTTETGENEGDIELDDTDGGEVTSDAEEAYDLVHEAFNLEEDFQRVSIPQGAEIYDRSLDHATTWNATGENYDDDVVNVDDVGTSELHHGLYVSGEDADARIGYEYSDEQVSPGEETLEEGWNLVGTNFDISDGDNIAQPLATDLLSVGNIDKSGSQSEFLMDGGLGTTLGADEDNTNDDTSELTDAIQVNEDNDGEYGTYWVYIEDTDEFDDNVRQVVDAEYTPGDRSDAIDSSGE